MLDATTPRPCKADARRTHGLQAFALLALVGACGAQAAVELSAERVVVDAVRLESMRLRWEKSEPGGRVTLEVESLQAMEHSWRRLHWQCELTAVESELSCAGPLRLGGRRAGELRARWSQDLQVHWQQQPISLSLQVLDAGPLHLEAKQMPLQWLQPLLQTVWAEGRLMDGSLDAEAEWVDETGALSVNGRLQGLGLESTDGRIAAAGLSGGLQFGLEPQGPHQRVSAGLDVSAGEVLFGPLYAELLGGSALRLQALQTADQRWTLERLHWRDPEGAQVQAQATLRTDAEVESSLEEWSLRLDLPRLAASAPRYLQSLTGWLGMPQLGLQGGLVIDSQGQGLQVDRVEASLRSVDLDEPQRELRLSDAEGRLLWSRSTQNESSELGWSGFSAAGFDFGPARIKLRSSAGALELVQPLHLRPLGGEIQIDQLQWQPLEGELIWGGAVRDLSLADLTRRFGWPELQGRLSGALPSARYADAVMSIDGGLRVDVLGGEVQLAGLRMERPLGVAPTLSADVQIENIELGPLTGTFGFGEITGWLDGRVQGLRLVNWSPVAFDARFITDPDYPGKQRISQRAVKDLSSVGGGLVAGLQNQILRVFDSFAYKRIGLNCRLQNDVCEMGGLDSSGTGYTVVEGAGLPRITVNGFQRRVDWPVLVNRLKAATQGRELVIE